MIFPKQNSVLLPSLGISVHTNSKAMTGVFIPTVLDFDFLLSQILNPSIHRGYVCDRVIPANHNKH